MDVGEYYRWRCKDLLSEILGNFTSPSKSVTKERFCLSKFFFIEVLNSSFTASNVKSYVHVFKRNLKVECT
jgi:hypothetical protein